MKRFTKMNINIICKVILTENGAQYLNKYHSKRISELYPIFESLSATSDAKKVFPTDYRKGDVLELPLWELMGKFGGYFEMYTEAAFINNQIEFLNETYR